MLNDMVRRRILCNVWPHALLRFERFLHRWALTCGVGGGPYGVVVLRLRVVRRCTISPHAILTGELIWDPVSREVPLGIACIDLKLT